MNFALMISVKVEEMLADVVRDDNWSQHDEDKEYKRCLAQVISERQVYSQAGGDIRIGDYILLGKCNRTARRTGTDWSLSGFRYPNSRRLLVRCCE